MEGDFAKMLRDLENMARRREGENGPYARGREDTVKLNRIQYRELFGKMAGIEASNTNKEHTEIKIGRLCVLESLLGHDKYGDLMATLGTLFEEYLFGLPGGEPSEYRVTQDNVSKKDGEY